MPGRGVGRRIVLLGAATAWAAGGGAARAAYDALAPAAATEPPITWYESSPPDQLDRIVRSFSARFPAVSVRTVRVVAGTDVTARIVAEAQAGAPGADVATASAESAWVLNERGLLASADWAALGVPAVLIAQPFALATAAVTHVIVYNTRAVAEGDAPRSWDDLLDPRWQGRFGTWTGAHPYTQLTALWGEARVDDYVARLARQKPMLFRSQFTLGQAVAAGEIDVGVAAYHTLLPLLAVGAPIRIVVPDPASASTVYSFMLRSTRSPHAARLFLAWLCSAEGAAAYEDATGRGIYLGHETRMSILLRGRRVSEFQPEAREQHYAQVAKHSAVLAAGGGSQR